ncbi:MAG: hypothetical protein PHQ40_15360 [Anaerolineaceae bacterium]|nr:hypothetical protein [Anaerolineaceae bacterium]
MGWLRILSLKLSRAFVGLSVLLRLGVVVFVLSGTLDLIYHGFSASRPGALDPFLGPDGYFVHLALFAGMLMILIGVILTKPHPEASQESDITLIASNSAGSISERR